MPDESEYMTPQQLTERYKGVITLRTLANWRSNRDGPAYTKIGGRVLYALCEVTKWECTRKIGALVFALIYAGFDVRSITDIFI